MATACTLCTGMDSSTWPHHLCSWWNKHWQLFCICKGPTAAVAIPPQSNELSLKPSWVWTEAFFAQYSKTIIVNLGIIGKYSALHYRAVLTQFLKLALISNFSRRAVVLVFEMCIGCRYTTQKQPGGNKFQLNNAKFKILTPSEVLSHILKPTFYTEAGI